MTAEAKKDNFDKLNHSVSRLGRSLDLFHSSGLIPMNVRDIDVSDFSAIPV